MLALQNLRWLLLAAEVLIALPILSLCIISISAILTAKRRKNQDAATSYANFAILAEAAKDAGNQDVTPELMGVKAGGRKQRIVTRLATRQERISTAFADDDLGVSDRVASNTRAMRSMFRAEPCAEQQVIDVYTGVRK